MAGRVGSRMRARAVIDSRVTSALDIDGLPRSMEPHASRNPPPLATKPAGGIGIGTQSHMLPAQVCRRTRDVELWQGVRCGGPRVHTVGVYGRIAGFTGKR